MNPIPHDTLLAQAYPGHALHIVTTLYLLLSLSFLVRNIASDWRLFTKANRPGWASLVPIYNLIQLLKIAGKPTWWLVMLFIPLVGIPFWAMMFHGISKAFGKDMGFTLGLFFLPWLFFPLLAFGNATYLGAEPVAVRSQPSELFT